MADKPLSIPEKSALLTLMLIGKSISNTELYDAYHFKIEAGVRTTLSRRGLIEAYLESKPRRHYVHTVTKTGWQVGLRALAEPTPGKVDKSFRILQGLVSALARNDQDFQALIRGGENGTEPAGEVAERIEATYESLVGRPGGWVSLTRLRNALDRVSRTEMDEALRQLSLRPQVYLIPEANQKILTPEDRAAAVELGGEAKHLLSIERV